MAIVKSEMTLVLRTFPLRLRDQRTGAEVEDTVTLEKSCLQAARLVGESSTEIITRLCRRAGYDVLAIGTPTKHTSVLDLDKLV